MTISFGDKKKSAKQQKIHDIMIEETRRKAGLPPLIRKYRVCLKCDEKFLSISNGDRICKVCRRLAVMEQSIDAAHVYCGNNRTTKRFNRTVIIK